MILERLTGFVDAVDGDTAFLTLHDSDGTELSGECSAAMLDALGIRERRRFTCETVLVDGVVEVRMRAVPDVLVTAEEEDAIRREIEEVLG